MSTQKAPKNAGLLTALDGLLSLAVLALAGYYIEYFYTVIEKGNASGKWGLVALMFLGMALAQVIRIYLARTRHHLDVIRHTVYAAVFLVCAVLILLSRQSADGAVLTIDAYTQDIHFKIVAWLYEASLIFSRVLTILRDRTRRSTLINLALIAVIVILMWQMEMISMILFIRLKWMMMEFSPWGLTSMMAWPVGTSTRLTADTSAPASRKRSRSMSPSAPTAPPWKTCAPARAAATV